LKNTTVIAALIAVLLPAAAYAASAPSEITLDSKVDSMKQAGVGPVKYPHAAHEKLYKCDDCHPKLFKDRHGANDLSMKANMEGRFCGSPGCHNSENAFPLFMCTNCHTEVKQ